MRKDFKSINKLYHFTKFDTAIKILGSHNLRFGRLHDMNDIHENDKLSFVDLSGNPIQYFSSDILETIDHEMAKYRQISLTIDDEEALLCVIVDRTLELAVHSVILKHVSQVLYWAKVVDTYYLILLSLCASCTEYHTADTTETVDTNLNL